MKTKQKFTYTENGENRVYLLLPCEYDYVLNAVKKDFDSLYGAAPLVGLSTNRIDPGSLKLHQTILDSNNKIESITTTEEN